MKTWRTLNTIIGTATVAVLVCTGCQKQEATNTTATTTENTAPSHPEDQVSVEETVTQTAEAAKQVISDANAKAQELLTQAQNLVSEKKYDEATSLLQKLGDFKLTPEQQKMLDDLKATIQKAMESEAVKQGTKAIGNVLGGDK